MRYSIFAILAIFIATACASKGDTVDLSTIQNHIVQLASDTFQGRMPCSEGEIKTLDYISNSLESLGLRPGNGDSYMQEVPLVEITAKMDEFIEVQTKHGRIQLESESEIIIHSERTSPNVEIKDSELVFCGYGIVSEKHGWNDYEGIDMRGKTAVVLINDPGFGSNNEALFNGDAMTYFGRWSYKYEEADRQGADGLIIIHETSSAGYPWFVIRSSWMGPMQGLAGNERANDCGIKGWIQLNTANNLFASCELDLASLIRRARTKDFKPVMLNATIDARVENQVNECISNNVVGYIEGSQNPDEYIVYTAHWDHIGVGTAVGGDSIYNGAMDNASGTASLLAIAETFAARKSAPDRSVLFLFVTAEEQGLLGSEYYTSNPLFPLEKTIVNLNMDGMLPAGKMKDFTITGMGYSEMDIIATEAALAQGRYVKSETEREKGYFFRSDHFNFAKRGIPVLYGEGSYEHATKGIEYVTDFKQEYVAKRYHSPLDEFDETWDLTGVQQDAQLYFNIGLKLANSGKWPQWFDSSSFQRKKPQLKN